MEFGYSYLKFSLEEGAADAAAGRATNGRMIVVVT